MTQLTVPFVEAAVVAYLDGILTEPVASRVPNPRPAAFVRISLVGGDQISLVQGRARMLFEAYSSGPVPAWQLASKVWKALEGRETLVLTLPASLGGGQVELGARDLSLPVNYPDPATTQDRYQFTAEATVNLVKELAS